MSNNLMVSVVVVTYNHEQFIAQCIQGILSQKVDFPIEIIIGDDNSKDGTRKVIENEIKKNKDSNKKIQPLFRDRNLGPPNLPGKYNWMDCVEKAKGRYIAFCDGDDFWTDTSKLKKQIDFLENNKEYSICFHNVNFYKDGVLTNNAPLKKDSFDQEDLIKGSFIYTTSAIIRNNLTFPKWYPEIRLGDWCLYLILTNNNEKIKYINETMATYRFHDAGFQSGNRKWPIEKQIKITLDDINMYKVLISFFVNKPILVVVLKQHLKIYYNKLRELYAVNLDYINSKRVAKKILKKYRKQLSFKELIVVSFNYFFPQFFSKYYNRK